jgi:hypothetical protein
MMARTVMGRGVRAALGAALVLVAAACGAQDGAAAKDDLTEAMNRQGDALRTRILGLASFAGLADSCSSGELRVFAPDSAAEAAAAMEELERLIISYGAGVSLDNADGRALLHALARLETYGPGIAWDVLEGEAPRTFNPIVTSRLPNPETGVCMDIPGLDPLALLVPQVPGWEVPRDSMVTPVVVGYGPEAVNELRNWYYERTAGAADSTLRYVRMTAHAMLGDYAMLAVQRESERQGVTPIPALASGASYLLHKVDGAWRLIGYARVW